MKLLLTTIRTDRAYTDYALRSLYSVVADSPIDVEMRSFGKYELDADIYEEIIRGQYNIVYFQMDDLNEYAASNVAEMVKKAVPSTAVVAGGMQVSFDTEDYMRANPWIDYVIRGEGETVFYQFLRSVVDFDFDFENIGGLAYRNTDQIIVNDYDEPAEMDDLPFVYDRTEADGQVLYYESSRGDADRTTYSQYLPDTAVRSLSLSRICRELRYFLVKEPERVVFFDKWFNYNSERAYRIFEYLISNDNGKTVFEFNICGENLDDETVRLLGEARSGLFEFNVEVASTNAEVLAAIGRRENIYQLMYNVTKLLQTGKVRVNISIIAGLPHETEALFARSFNKAYGLCEGSPLRIKSLNVGKGTELRADAGRLGYEYTYRSPYDVISSDAMSAQDLIRIRMISRVTDAYIGEGGYKASLPRIMNDAGLKPYDLFSMLTDYIYANRFETKLHRRDQLARILFAWAGEIYKTFEDDIKLDILRDAIHADLEKELPEDQIVRFERDGWEISKL